MLVRISPKFSPHLTTLRCTRMATLLSTTRTVVLSAWPASPCCSTHALQPRPYIRMLSTPAPHITHSDLPMDLYHALADTTMTSLLERLENLLDDIANDAFEVDYHSGVLTLNLGSNGTYVINKQPPNKQIWLSSPVSGPKRYDYVLATNDWRYSRTGEEMGVLLEQELGRALGREVILGLGDVSETA